MFCKCFIVVVVVVIWSEEDAKGQCVSVFLKEIC